MSDLLTALVLLARTSGHTVASQVDRNSARRDRGGTWTLRDHDDVELAEVNPEAGLCLVHSWANTQRVAGPATARVESTRLECACGHLFSSPGRVDNGSRHSCPGCLATAFVVG